MKRNLGKRRENVFGYYCETSAALRKQTYEHLKDRIEGMKRGDVLRFSIVSDDDTSAALLKGRVSVLRKGIRAVNRGYYKYMKSIHVKFFEHSDLLDKARRKEIMDSEQLLFLVHEEVEHSLAKKVLPHPDVYWFCSDETEAEVRPPWPVSALRVREE